VGLAGDVIAHVLAEQAAIFRIAAADACAEQDADGLALEERRALLRARGERQNCKQEPAQRPQSTSHSVLPPDLAAFYGADSLARNSRLGVVWRGGAWRFRHETI